MGLLDKAKEMFGKADADSVKDAAGSAKDKADDLVDQHRDKVPDSVENAYDKASDAAEKIIPGDDEDDAGSEA